jgi:molecular chaperone DnaK (HSP70)
LTATYAIGIDLGTTNCAIAATPLSADQPAPAAGDLPQIIAAGEVASESLLPSFLYVPAAEELAPGALDLPWKKDAPNAVGRFARDRGASSPLRLVSSAKSWLCHAGVDRRKPILPWGAPDDVAQVSPVNASAQYLQHLRAAWDEAHPDAPLAEQDLVLTVPASFDAVARDLTAEAARDAGLPEGLRLLEEPQAALYAWLADQGAAWRKQLVVGDVILVCDIGGGTTDFSLISVHEEDGALNLERIAVGEHILLGGDNMDLALAYGVRARLEAEGKKLDDWQMRALTHGCRAAKEGLLSDESKDTWPLVVPSRGRKLIGGSIKTELTRDELSKLLLEGFLPETAAADRPQKPRRMGLATMGLPYASDAGITRHLAAFLGKDGLPRGDGHSFVHPTAILFNGGVTRSPVVRDRLRSILGAWLEAEGGSAPKVLEGGHPDLAVSRGAACYAHSRAKGGMRIKGGTARAYYVGVERSELAVPGVPPRLDALCIAPFGMEEGADAELDETFGLYLGETAAFRFFSSSERREDAVGAVVSPDELEELAPIETTLEGDAETMVPVHLHAQVTELGTLELAAVQQEGEGRWKLSFDVRVE